MSALGGSTVDRELIVAVPGPWKDRSEFLGQIISSTDGKFMLPGATKEALKALPKFEYERHPRPGI